MTYRQVELPCPKHTKIKNWACVGLFDDIVAVILPPITKRLERAFTYQSFLLQMELRWF